MFDITKLERFLPFIEKPVHKLSLNTKLKWTGLALIVYFLLSSQLFGHVYGVAPNISNQFQSLQMLLGSTFGTLMTLGIGPIVTASILLQLLIGSKIIKWDMSDEEDKRKFQVTQKVAALSLCFIEAVAYVLAGAVPASSNDPFTISIVIFQLALGGVIVLMLDEIVSKYGIGSGISLFIAAGVTNTIFIRMFTPFTALGAFPSAFDPPTGAFWAFTYSLLSNDMMNAVANFLPIIMTIIVFIIIVYAQGITVDIPLSFSRLRGFGRRWSLNLFYTSNIPVILTAALLANLQLWANMSAKPLDIDPNTKCGMLGCFTETGGGTVPISGVVYYLSAPHGILFNIITRTVTSQLLLRALTYLLFMIIVCIVFSVFWVSTSGMDSESISGQISSIGMQIPGYRSDPRIIKKVLDRYITPLAVLGGAAIGLLAAFADFTGAFGTGTGILLSVTIIYNFYQQLKTERIEDAHPLIRKVIGEE